MIEGRTRLAIVVSHPIQYYAPLYQRLTLRDDLSIRVFFTWHGGERPVKDRGFAKPFAWDIPVTGGYDYEVVANTSTDPGTHHFFGLRNPGLVERILGWNPDVVHITGWAWLSHLQALRTLHRLKVPVLFRGDSHLMNAELSGPRWWAKRFLLRWIYSWPTSFPGRGLGEPGVLPGLRCERRAFAGLSSLDRCRPILAACRDLGTGSGRVAEGLGISESGEGTVIRRQVRADEAAAAADGRDEELRERWHGVGLGQGGELEAEMSALAASSPEPIRILPFQNQSRMPAVYRLGEAPVLPTMGDSWGLAVNEALACGRPVLVSDRAGCAADVVDGTCGAIFPWNDGAAIIAAFRAMTSDRENPVGSAKVLPRGPGVRHPQTERSTAGAALAVAVRR
ncbi:MAG: glycosyltransferase [Thermoanaerobaculia bacterium]